MKRPIFGAVLSVLLVTASCSASPPAATTTSSRPATTATTTTTVATSTTTTTTTTTTATEPPVASRAELVIYIGTGPTYTSDAGPVWLWGDVSAEASVEINGVAANVEHLGRASNGDELWRWNEADEAAGGVMVPLEVGLNTISVVATFQDGSAITRYIRHTYDPTLVKEQGYLVALVEGTPATATLELADFILDEWGVSDAGTQSDVVDVPIVAGAVFTLIPLMLEQGPQNLDEQDMFELQELNRNGPLDNYWWDIVFAPYATDRAHKGAPWEFLLTANGELQQATQLYSP